MDVKFGDVYTNGINHWIVIFAGMISCPTCNKGEVFKMELVPVVLENGEPRHLIWEKKITDIHDIKPFARKAASLSKIL